MSGPFDGQKLRRCGGTLARFKAPKPKAGPIMEAREDSRAMVYGTTMFPSTVVPALDSPRLLVSGHNNPKTGKTVLKGLWSGMPIYTLTLEERATCPSYCHMYRSCYGNSMHLARRHRLGLDFELRLSGEIRAKMREHPQGIVVRLHVLGDFYRAAYVELWRHMMAEHPLLHVFGYTRREPGGYDEDVFRMIEIVKAEFPTRFRVRFSRPDPVPDGSVVIERAEDASKGVVVCPAQSETTATCGTCGLCWAPASVVPTIGFLRHGRRPGRKGGRPARDA